MPAPYLEQIRRAKEWQDAKVSFSNTPTLKEICLKTVSRHMDVLDKKALGKCLNFDATKGVFTLCWTKDDLGCIKAKCYSAILANACTIHEWAGTQPSSQTLGGILPSPYSFQLLLTWPRTDSCELQSRRIFNF